MIVPTIGRETLRATVDSIAPQLLPCDELLVVADGPTGYEKAVVYHPDVVQGEPSGDYGNKLRDYAMQVAKGKLLMFCDDDDTYTPDALATVRRRCDRQRTRLHIFRMQSARDGILWGEQHLNSCNVGTPMFVLPNNTARLGRWQNSGGPYSDHHFITQTAALHPLPPVFHEEIIAVVGGTP